MILNIDDGKKDILLGLKDYQTNVGIVWYCIEWKGSGESRLQPVACFRTRTSQFQDIGDG